MSDGRPMIGICTHPDCGKPIWPGQPNVYLGLAPGSKRGKGGFMHLSCWGSYQTDLRRLVEAAVREGRHSLKHKYVCGRCGEFCDALAHKTLDGVYVCRACAVKSGEITEDGRDADQAAVEELARLVREGKA